MHSANVLLVTGGLYTCTKLQESYKIKPLEMKLSTSGVRHMPRPCWNKHFHKVLHITVKANAGSIANIIAFYLSKDPSNDRAACTQSWRCFAYFGSPLKNSFASSTSIWIL